MNITVETSNIGPILHNVIIDGVTNEQFNEFLEVLTSDVDLICTPITPGDEIWGMVADKYQFMFWDKDNRAEWVAATLKASLKGDFTMSGEWPVNADWS